MRIRQIFGALLLSLSVLLLPSDDGLMVIAILLGIIGMVLIFKKPRTKAQQKEMKEQRKKQREYNAVHISATHQAGLPLAQDAVCEIEYAEDKFIFRGAGNTFNLDFNKISDICTKTDAEIQNQYVSSVGGAVAGAVVFGPLGAIVGGRAKKKTETKITQYLIFTYNKDDKVDYISFELYYSGKEKEWIKDFRSKHLQLNNSVVDL